MRSLGVVVARRASKRLPDKVLRPLLGKPLLAYAVCAAAASRLDRVLVSTEDEAIAAVARRFGAEAPFLRPPHLAEDFAASHETLLHALDWAEADEAQLYDVVVLIQATTPFMLPRHIDACLEALRISDANCCFTARTVREPPHWMFVAKPDGAAETLLAGHLEGARQYTQNLPPVLLPTGAAFALRAAALREQRRIYAAPLRTAEMEVERSIDIDEPLDLVVAEAIGRHFGFGLVEARRGEPAERSATP
jgi:CMP-N-acetylneuraminic acid synthetase